jgi:hypothetical protein
MQYTKRTIFVSQSRVFEAKDSDQLPRVSAKTVAQNAKEGPGREDIDAAAVVVSPAPSRTRSSE